jgi:hypothetical protein
MSGYLIGAVTLAYVATAVDLYLSGRVGLAICFAGYSVANVGLILDLKG